MARFLQSEKLDDFLRAVIGKREVFAHDEEDGQYHLACSEEWDPERHVLGDYRPVEPLKALVFRPREYMGRLAKAAAADLPERVVIGVKNCDLSSLKIHDWVFLKNSPADPFYKEAREKTLIVSCDCADCLDVCFCPAVNEQPYAKEGYDINLSPVESGYVVETGSEKGEEALKAAGSLLADAGADVIAARDKRREEMTKKVAAQAEKKGLKAGQDYRKAVQSAMGSEMWKKFADDCVECGACNFSCCTCHCFLLVDGLTADKQGERHKQWDSCLYKNFARVAGGENPRQRRAERLYNRFDKKFNYFPTVMEGFYACDGCGRCTEACTGEIDIREVLKTAIDESK